MSIKKYKPGLSALAIGLFALWSLPAFGAENLEAIVGNVQSNIKVVADLLIIISYVAGVGFALAGVLQFKAHKDNPAQVPLSKPIVFLAVGAALLFLPTILESAGETVFGGKQTSAKEGTAL